MWNTSYTNQICSKIKKLLTGFTFKKIIKRTSKNNNNRTIYPLFYAFGWMAKRKKRQEEDKIEKVNTIYYTKIFMAKFKHSRYSRYEAQPKQICPAFRHFSRYKLSDILNMIRIRKGNIGYENKIGKIKSDYDRVDMRKEAYKQKLYLNNLLKIKEEIIQCHN